MDKTTKTPNQAEPTDTAPLVQVERLVSQLEEREYDLKWEPELTHANGMEVFWVVRDQASEEIGRGKSVVGALRDAFPG